jgi:hypothetical protein
MILRRRTSQVLASVLTLAAVVPIVWYWIRLGVEAASGPAQSLWYRPLVMSVVLLQVGGLAAVGIALAIVWKASDYSASGRALVFFLVAFCVYQGSFGLIGFLRVLVPDYGPLAYDVVFAGAVAVGLGAFVRFSALFPLPTPEIPTGGASRWRRRGRYLRTTLGGLRPILVGSTIAGAALLVDGIFDWPGVMGYGPAVEVAMPLGFGIAAMNLWTSYLDADASDRAKIFWVAEGAVLLFLGISLPFTLQLASGAFGAALPDAVSWYALSGSSLGFVACLGFAVFGRGAVHSGLLLRRTTIAGGLTVTILFVFAGLEDVLTDLVVSRIGLPDAAGTWLAGGLIAISLNPLYRWLEKRLK